MQLPSPRKVVDTRKLLEPRKVFLSLLLGLAGFLGAFFSFQFSAPPLRLSILWSYTFPLLAALAYGGRYGLIAGLFGFGALYPFFLWETNGWANVVTAALILGWFTWHGYCARRHARHPAIWNHPLTAQLVFAFFYVIVTRYGYPPTLAANPPAWAPEALTSLPVAVLDGVAIKGTLNLFLGFFAAMTALITPEVRKFLHLPIAQESRDNSKIVLGALACAVALWVILLLAYSIFIEFDFPVGVFPPDSPYEIIALVIFLAMGLITGYIFAQYVEMRQKTAVALSASEARFRGIFEHSQIGIAIVNAADLSFAQYNAHFMDIVGYSAAELQQLTPKDITHPEDWLTEWRYMQESLKHPDQPFAIEKRFVRKDGTVRWARVMGETLQLQASEPAFTLTSIVDITERKTAELAIQASEARFRGIFEQAAVGISHASLDGRFLRVNQQLCRMLGYSREELLTLRYQDISHPDDLEDDRLLGEQLVRGETETFTLEKRYIRRDRSCFWINLTVSLQRDLDGAPEYFIAVVEDITARRQTNEALRESEQRYRNTFERAAVGINHTALDGRFTRVNDRFCEITGYSREELLVRNFKDITHPDDLDYDAALEERLIHGGQETYQREKRYVRPDGTIVWVSLTVSLLRDDTGAPNQFISVAEDITARKQAEEALARERILLRTVIDNLPDAVYVKDLQLRKVLANRADVVNMGITNEASALGKTDADVFAPNVAARFAEDDLQVLAGEPIFDREERLVRPSGDERWLLTSKMPLRDDQGRVIGIVGIGHDITERKRNEEALREGHQHLLMALAELQETQNRMVQQERLAAVGQLAAGIAHDFNNILAVITLYAQLALQSPDLSETIATRLRVILQQAKRAADLIQQIVDFSRRTMLERRPMDLLPFVKEQIKLLERTLPENIHVSLQASGHEFIVNADPTRLQQTLLNLAVNARDAMPDGGDLRITMSHLSFSTRDDAPFPDLEPGIWVQLSITDTGTGIAPDVLQHMFEPFFTTKAPGKGTGLGLAQVHGIVKQHQGEIQISTCLGEGSTFTVYLPAALSQDSDTLASSQEPLELGQGQRILIVEDDANVRDTLVSTLELLNYRTFEAIHGREALAVIEQHGDEIALILSDYVMPEMGGQGLVQALRQRNLHQPVIILSGYPLSSELAELQAQGLTDWLLKPPEVEHLAHVVAQALRQHPHTGVQSG